MDRTLANYSNYIMNNPQLTPEQKQNYLKDVTKIQKAVEARKKLTEKLLDYEKKRRKYLQQTKYFTDIQTPLKIVQQPFLIPESNKK